MVAGSRDASLRNAPSSATQKQPSQGGRKDVKRRVARQHRVLDDRRPLDPVLPRDVRKIEVGRSHSIRPMVFELRQPPVCRTCIFREFQQFEYFPATFGEATSLAQATLPVQAASLVSSP